MKPLRIALIADGSSPNTERLCKGLTSAQAEIHVISFTSNVPTAKKIESKIFDSSMLK